jgi:hypothetical protein
MKIGPYCAGEWIAGLLGVVMMSAACALLIYSAGSGSQEAWPLLAVFGSLLGAFVLFRFFVPSDTVRHIRDGRDG